MHNKFVSRIFRYLLSIPKTIYINFRIFDFKTALKFPIICSSSVRIGNLPRCGIKIYGELSFGMIKFGISHGSFSGGRNGKSYINIEDGGFLVFCGKADICNYFSINIESNGFLQIGKDFWSNYGLLISCAKRIEFGEKDLLGWNCSFIDADGHKVFLDNGNGEISNSAEEIVIGDHTWFTANTVCLKGVCINNDSIVAQGCVLTKRIDPPNVIIGGVPGRVIRTGINWEK